MYVQIFRCLLKTRNKTSEMIRKRNENDNKSSLNLTFFLFAFPFSSKFEVVNNKNLKLFSILFFLTRTMSCYVKNCLRSAWLSEIESSTTFDAVDCDFPRDKFLFFSRTFQSVIKHQISLGQNLNFFENFRSCSHCIY